MDWQRFFDRMVIGFFIMLFSFVGVVLIGISVLAIAQEAGLVWGVMTAIGLVVLAVMLYCLPGARERERIREYEAAGKYRLRAATSIPGIYRVPCKNNEEEDELNKQNP